MTRQKKLTGLWLNKTEAGETYMSGKTADGQRFKRQKAPMRCGNLLGQRQPKARSVATPGHQRQEQQWSQFFRYAGAVVLDIDARQHILAGLQQRSAMLHACS